MGFEKGNKSSKGRPKGSGNKVSQNVKSLLQSIYDGNLANIQTDLDAMSPKDKWATLNKMSDKFLPSLKSIDATVETTVTKSLGFEIEYNEDNKEKDNKEEDK